MVLNKNHMKNYKLLKINLDYHLAGFTVSRRHEPDCPIVSTLANTHFLRWPGIHPSGDACVSAAILKTGSTIKLNRGGGWGGRRGQVKTEEEAAAGLN